MIFGVVLGKICETGLFFAWRYGDFLQQKTRLDGKLHESNDFQVPVFTELLFLLTHIFKHLSVPVEWKGAADGKAILISEPLKRLVPQLNSLNFPYMSSV